MICKVCNKTISKNEKITVLSDNVVSLSDDCDYSYLGDFLDHEVIIHHDCFKEICPDLICKKKSSDDEIKPLPYDDRIDKFYDLLKELDEDVNKKQVKEFLSKNQELNFENLISHWFEQRNAF